MFSLVAIILLSKQKFLSFFNMSIINDLENHNLWQKYLENKITKSHMTAIEEKNLIEYINNKKYLEITKGIINGSYTFSIPKKSVINKSGSRKKRVVYTYNTEENIILKFMLFLMYRYDSFFIDNCYSFRQEHTVKMAISLLTHTENINNLFAYKVDISNYFNSIDTNILLKQLNTVLVDDRPLFNFIKTLLFVDKSIYKDSVIEEKRGAMAGTPLSAFFANLYLRDLDNYFYKKGITYIRYSDDIIVFDNSLEKLDEHRAYILEYIRQMKLEINPTKEQFFEPKDGWNFLGFDYRNGEIDISSVTVKKIKDKIRRKARALYRWKLKNNKTTEHTIKVMLRVFNNKFFREKNTKDLSWSKWYFPVINTHKTLKDIDNYLIQYIRYLSTGRFTKKNYNIKYDYLKSLGYRSLVNEFYKFQEK